MRIPRVTERFNRAVRRLGATSGSPAGVALNKTIRAMLSAKLPGPQDAEGLMPPVARYWFRRVPAFNLWLWFAFDDGELILVSLTDDPPVPVDSEA
jgi:hypothetical protein